MKINKVNLENKEILQVYLTKEEKDREDIKCRIEQLKKENKNLVVFVSGNEEIINHLKYMIQYSCNLCSC